jgi:hypothetical protein
VPIILLAEWDIEAKLFDGELAAGPVPALFSEDEEAAASALASGARKAHQDLQRAMKIFLMPEVVDLDEATALVKKPR